MWCLILPLVAAASYPSDTVPWLGIRTKNPHIPPFFVISQSGISWFEQLKKALSKSWLFLVNHWWLLVASSQGRKMRELPWVLFIKGQYCHSWNSFSHNLIISHVLIASGLPQERLRIFLQEFGGCNQLIVHICSPLEEQLKTFVFFKKGTLRLHSPLSWRCIRGIQRCAVF